MITTVTITREITITRDINVEVRYIPAVRATHMEPGEPADIEVLDAYDGDNGVITELTDSEVDEVREMVLQDPPQRDCD